MEEHKSFFDGFQRGWESVVGPALPPPDIHVPDEMPSGSRYMQGLIMGIEAGKQKIKELS